MRDQLFFLPVSFFSFKKHRKKNEKLTEQTALSCKSRWGWLCGAETGRELSGSQLWPASGTQATSSRVGAQTDSSSGWHRERFTAFSPESDACSYLDSDAVTLSTIRIAAQKHRQLTSAFQEVQSAAFP